MMSKNKLQGIEYEKTSIAHDINFKSVDHSLWFKDSS